MREPRAVWGGRARVRMVLYTGALVAKRYHPVIRAFHQRMLADGKAWKVALATCMRALLAVLDGMVKSGLHSKPDTVVS